MLTVGVLVRSTGATQAHRLRPVDVLTKILREDRPGKLAEFFSLFGATEASAMCYAVATTHAQEASSVWLLAFFGGHYGGTPSSAVSAVQCLMLSACPDFAAHLQLQPSHGFHPWLSALCQNKYSTLSLA